MGDPAVAQASLDVIKKTLGMIYASQPSAQPAAIDEFAAAVPAESEPEPEQFSTRPAPVTFDTSAPIGLADVVEATPPVPGPAIPAISEAPVEESVDLSGATMLTTADDLKKRIAESKPAPVEEPVPAAVVEATPIEEAIPAAEVVAAEPVEEAPIAAAPVAAAPEKPDLAPPWEQLGPPPGVEEKKGPVWDSQWSGGEEAAPAAAAVEAPAAEAPPATPYAPEEFAAAMSAALAQKPAEAPAGPAAAPRVDEATVNAIVERVIARISPMVLQALAQEFVRPLAETLLDDYYDEQEQKQQ
jgi:hypothetical protein